MKTESLQELSLRTDNRFSYDEIRGVIRRQDIPLTSPYPYDKITDLQYVNGFESIGPENRVVTVYYSLINRFAIGKDPESEVTLALFMQRIENDPHALNWLVHSELCDRWLAGNDHNLIDLVLTLSAEHKLSLLYAISRLNRSELMQMRYGMHVDQAVQAVCDYASQSRCQFIDYLPVNFELSFFSTSLINSEIGAPGSSAVILNASPLNTLPRSLLYEISQQNNIDLVSDAAKDKAMGFKLPTELSHELSYSMIQEVFESSMTSSEFRSAIAKKTKGTVNFDDIYELEWNTDYPVITSEINDMYKVSDYFPQKNALSTEDNNQMIAVFSKYIAYGSIEGLGRPSCNSMFKENPRFDMDNFTSPGPSLLHNFSHLDAPFGREQIDAYIESYQDVISSGYTSRYASVAAHKPEMGERLLGYLHSMHQPSVNGEPSRSLYHYALAKLIALTLLRGKALYVFDPKHLSLSDFMKNTGLASSINDSETDSTYERHLLEIEIRALPAELRPLDVLLCCGIGASEEELAQASEIQLLRSLSQDLGM